MPDLARRTKRSLASALNPRPSRKPVTPATARPQTASKVLYCAELETAFHPKTFQSKVDDGALFLSLSACNNNMTNMSMANPMLAAALALAVAMTATAAAAREQDPVSTSYLIDETARGRDFLVSEGSPCVFSARPRALAISFLSPRCTLAACAKCPTQHRAPRSRRRAMASTRRPGLTACSTTTRSRSGARSWTTCSSPTSAPRTTGSRWR